MTAPGPNIPGAPDVPDAEQCRAKGCRRAAPFAVVWNNPALHAPERRKVWLACAEHRDSLRDFVARRGFLIDVVDAAELGPADG